MNTAAETAGAVDFGTDILQGMQNALAYARGDGSKGRAHVVDVPAVDVEAVRAKLGLSQDKFAAVFGVSVRTVRKWEQGERRLTGAVSVLPTETEYGRERAK